MNEWMLIEKALAAQPIDIRLERAEKWLVREALEAMAERAAEDFSPWRLFEALQEAPGKMGMAVKGLTPQEVEVVKQQPPGKGAQVKKGDTGEVMMLDPKSWLAVKQEIEANPEYYNMLMGGIGDVDSLTDKIGKALRLQMGPKMASQPQGPVPFGTKMSGKPSDPTPAVHGPEKFGEDALTGEEENNVY